jgi:hypothetical protein
MREYFVDGDSQINDAADITSHVPKYLPSNIIKLSGSTTEDIIVALSKDAQRQLSVYRYYWSGGEKLQSSWSIWEFDPGTTILNCDFIESELFLVTSRSDGTYLESISVEPGYTEQGSEIPCLLDRLLTNTQVTRSYNATTNETTITLPFPVTDAANWRVIAWTGDATYRQAYQVKFTATNSTTFVVKGNLTSFRIGRTYQFRYVFSQLVVRTQAPGGGQMAVMSGRVQLRRMKVIHTGSGYFKAIVSPAQRSTYEYVYSGRVIGDGENQIGSPAVNDTPFSFPVNAKNDQVSIELVSDSHMPCAFLSAEWEALYQIRSRRI